MRGQSHAERPGQACLCGCFRKCCRTQVLQVRRGLKVHFMIGQIKKLGSRFKCISQFLLNSRQTPRDMSLGMAKYGPNLFQWPTGIFSQREHRQVPPATFIVTCEMQVNYFPKVVAARSGQDHFSAITSRHRHAKPEGLKKEAENNRALPSCAGGQATPEWCAAACSPICTEQTEKPHTLFASNVEPIQMQYHVNQDATERNQQATTLQPNCNHIAAHSLASGCQISWPSLNSEPVVMSTCKVHALCWSGVSRVIRSILALSLVLWPMVCTAAAPPPPAGVTLRDHRFDGGRTLDVIIQLPMLSAEELQATLFVVERCGEYGGLYEERLVRTPNYWEIRRGEMVAEIDDCVRGESYWFRVASRNLAKEKSVFIAPETEVAALRSWLDGSRLWIGVLGGAVCLSVVAFILLARAGWPLKIRPIAGLAAVEEAVGRATEMGRACLFIPGIQDMNEMQTIAGLAILSNVAQRTAEYDCHLETPTTRSLVMTAARETVAAAYLLAGRPDAYNEDSIYYVTDEQFAYVSYVTGYMVREKPAACFYLGSFFAESLILAETGNSIGAIQIAGTAQPSQLPFFVAACDYTLIGEELFAASAYLTKDPDQLGSLKGQDFGKLIVAALLLMGVGLATCYEVTQADSFRWLNEGLRDVVLYGGS